MSVDIPRETALKILDEINEKEAYSNISLNKHLSRKGLREIDHAFITELVYGTIKWQLTIDWIIEQFSNIKSKKLSHWILNILRLGVYQLLYMDRVPASAACSESVTLAKKYGHPGSVRYVNGVLRNIEREKDKIKYPEKDKDPVKYLEVKYSHPEWLVKMWLEYYGLDFTEALLKANNQIADFTIRVNTLKTTKEDLINELKANGLEVQPGRYAKQALSLIGPSSISKLEPFKKGLFQVQSESSILVGEILDPKPGEFIIDVCSAPGGKTTHIAEIMKDSGTVLARDIYEHKLELIKEAALRLGLNSIKTEIWDAVNIDEKYIKKADKVLVDVPCTGLGIIRRKPDIKYSKIGKDIKGISELQLKILNASSHYVKPGGIIVYSTCTISPEENNKVVENFMKQREDFQLEDFSGMLPENLDRYGYKEGYIQLYPNVHKTDGFFIAKFRRKQ
ncbi:MAG TPA: 16S rRNA (cytosine(967)-C(5))-methyltransferase RsmB [Clostridiaceae bacterium]|nr:16S rRNA (cytosine(967)-C(5))-methyltransferase RsmB [Clostridiaceae bacterium]